MISSKLTCRLAASLTGLVLMGVVPMAVAGPGKSVFEQTCIACHGPDGKGVLPGVPDFTDKGGPLSQPEEVLVQNVLNGFQSPGSPMAMPPKGGNADLTEADVVEVVKYMRDAFAPR
ncbi:c-type cytochrome [Denitromonas sp.]|uniref:c-type cytochrome n=1 Tax=Denitromonas sp. TaxID=2734609 RepID=UPI002AFF454E|nr:c-type cytochrome [Denitromonas sp.]